LLEPEKAKLNSAPSTAQKIYHSKNGIADYFLLDLTSKGLMYRLTNLLPIFLFLCLSTFGVSQNEKAHFQLDFNSDYEAQAFESLEQEASSNPLSLFLASSRNTDLSVRQAFRKELDQLIQKLEQKKIKEKSIRAGLKVIYRIVDREVLKQYQTHVQFTELFENGKYNCVTATALYSVIFNHFDIPYTIKLEPNHVFLIVDPEDKPIVFETTDPIRGINIISYKEKYKYVESLLEKKKISIKKKTIKKVKELYRSEFLYTDKNIELIELAAAQYYNNALEDVENEDYHSALINTEKSDQLYNTVRNNYLQMVCLYRLVSELDYENPESFIPLFKLYHISPTKELESEINHHFVALSEELLFQNPDSTKFNWYFDFFSKALAGHPLDTEIKSTYFMQKAKAASLGYDYGQAQNFLNQAHQLNPNDLRIKRVLTDMVMEQFKLENTSNKLDLYLKKYPFLQKHPLFDKKELSKQALVQPTILLPIYGTYFWHTATQQKKGLLPQFKGQLKLDPNYKIFNKAIKHLFKNQTETVSNEQGSMISEQ